MKFFSVFTSKWFLRFVVVVFISSFLGIFSYFLSAKYLSQTVPGPTLDEIKKSLVETNTQEKEFRDRLENEIATLKTKIDTLGNRDLNVLSLTTSPAGLGGSSLGQITVKDANLTSVAIYETKSSESRAVGSAEYGVVYPFYEKSGDWYKISQGWVEARWFIEVKP